MAEDAKSVTAPGDPIVGVKQTVKGKPSVLGTTDDYGNFEGKEEYPAQAIDGDTATKYFNKAVDGSETPGINTGFVVTPKAGATVVTAIQFASGNDAEERDPVKISIEGATATALSTAAFPAALVNVPITMPPITLAPEDPVALNRPTD